MPGWKRWSIRPRAWCLISMSVICGWRSCKVLKWFVCPIPGYRQSQIKIAGPAGTACEDFWIHIKPSWKSTWGDAGWVSRSSLQEWANLVEPISYRSTTPMGEVTVPTTETVCPCLRLGIIAAMKWKSPINQPVSWKVIRVLNATHFRKPCRIQRWCGSWTKFKAVPFWAKPVLQSL